MFATFNRLKIILFNNYKVQFFHGLSWYLLIVNVCKTISVCCLETIKRKYALLLYFVLTNYFFTVEQVSLSSTPAPAVTPSPSAVASVVSQEMRQRFVTSRPQNQAGQLDN
jgi:hypothetical protein